MPAVMITCSLTDQLVPTHTQADSLEDIEPTDNIRMNCPSCGQDHEWTVADAVLASE